jgi:DNA-binding CsgD family transcriptional regulator
MEVIHTVNHHLMDMKTRMANQTHTEVALIQCLLHMLNQILIVMVHLMEVIHTVNHHLMDMKTRMTNQIHTEVALIQNLPHMVNQILIVMVHLMEVIHMAVDLIKLI